MNPAPFPSLTPREFVRLLVARRRLWIGAAAACGALAAVWSLAMPRYWEASQALVVRQETAGVRGATPGKFSDLYEMRTLQETILELARSQQVVVNTLKAVDQRLAGVTREPTAEDIDKFRQRLKMLPPNGGEFGKSEVFYFVVKDGSRQRAIELVGELCRQLDLGLKDLRETRATSLVRELEQEVALATESLNRETQRLAEFEAEVGADLGELRMLHSASSGQSDLRQESVQLEADRRKFAAQVRETEQLLVLLRAAEQDPQQLIATPNSLLASQPALRRLKEGLLDAQLASARLAGTRSADHPRVKAAAEAETQIRADLHRELATAINGAEVELRLAQQRLAATDARRLNLEGRLGRLAQQRAEYSNRVAAVDSSRLSLDHAQQNLNTAMAARAAAGGGSLVTRLDQPETGPYPAGPGRTVVTGAGAIGGLMLGLGLVLLTTGAPTTPRPEPATSRSGPEQKQVTMAAAPLLPVQEPQRPESPAASLQATAWAVAAAAPSAAVGPAPSAPPLPTALRPEVTPVSGPAAEPLTTLRDATVRITRRPTLPLSELAARAGTATLPLGIGAVAAEAARPVVGGAPQDMLHAALQAGQAIQSH